MSPRSLEEKERNAEGNVSSPSTPECINSCPYGSRLRFLGKLPAPRPWGTGPCASLCTQATESPTSWNSPNFPQQRAIYRFRKSPLHLLLLEAKQVASINHRITSFLPRACSLLKPRCLLRRTLSNSDFNMPALTICLAWASVGTK